MSSQSDLAELISELSSVHTEVYVQFASDILMVHDCIITFDLEVNMFWKRKLNGAALLFYLNRYVFLLRSLVHIASGIPTYKTDRVLVTQASFAIGILPYLVWAVFSGLRAFALSRQWLLSGTVCLLSLVSFGINMSQYGTGLRGIVMPVIGCAALNDVPLSMARSCMYLYFQGDPTFGGTDFPVPVTIASRTCLMAADAILIYITWKKLFSARKWAAIRSTDNGITFAEVLLRDGTIYFIVLLGLNSLHLTLTLLSFDDALQNTSVVTAFTEPITAILVSRFLIDLQSAERQAVHFSSSTERDDAHAGNDAHSLVFERFVGSLGSSFMPAPEVHQGTDDKDVTDTSVAASIKSEADTGKDSADAQV